MTTKGMIFAGKDLQQYFRDIKKYKLLTSEEEIDLAKKIEKGDKEAFDQMVNSNLRLVIKIATKYATPEWQLSDLIQEGNIGLLKTVEKFDYRRNVRFSTYASWWIKQSIVRSLSNKRRAIRLPHRKEEKLRKINRAINELCQELKRNPSLKEVAKRLGFEEMDIVNLKNISDNMMSIDAEVNNNEGCYFINMLCDYNHSPENEYNKHKMVEDTDRVLGKLKDKEKKILQSRYAFHENDKQTLKTIAKDLGISPETVRQIEIKAIKKIRDNFPYLKDYLYI